MIVRNGKIFISHTAEDAGLIVPLTSRLDEKQVDYWAHIQPGDGDAQLSPATQNEIATRDVFLRIRTPAAAASERMHRETAAFRAVEQKDVERGTPNQHIIIDLLMDPTYVSNADDSGYLTIDAASRPMDDWLVVLYQEMGEMQATQTMSHRTLSILIVVGAVAILVLAIFLLAVFLKML